MNNATYYAIADIHGRLDLMNALIEQIDEDCVQNDVKNPVLVFLGDYVDRGPQSAGVVDRVIELSKERNVIPLMGNHEDIILILMSGALAYFENWFYRAGGAATLASYGWKNGEKIKLTELIKPEHVQFFQSLKLYHETEDHIFVHAGLKPGVSLAKQDDEDCLWIREGFLDSDYDFGKIVIHGHTPTDDGQPEVLPNRVNLDTKAFRSDVLTCGVFETGSRVLRIIQTPAPSLASQPAI